MESNQCDTPPTDYIWNNVRKSIGFLIFFFFFGIVNAVLVQYKTKKVENRDFD